MNPTFSICIPNYNYGRYIGDTIQSVLDQSYPHFEIIVADNASTDNSVEVVQSFNDPRIRLVQNRTNVGFGPNLQRATMHARHDFVNLLSSDDQMKPDALESYAQVLQKMGSDAGRTVLFSQAEIFDNDNHVWGLIEKAPDGFYNRRRRLSPQEVGALPGRLDYHVYAGRDVLADSLRRLKTFAPFLTIVYPRALWQAVEGYTGMRTIGPDKHFNYKLLALDPCVVYVRRPLFRYRDFPSANRSTQTTTLKQPIDDYLYTLEWREDDLRPLGLSRDELIAGFIDRVCLREGMAQLKRGNVAHAFRLFAFALASYPGTAVRNAKLYPLLGFFLAVPLALAYLLGRVSARK
jgi:glycosyltransferase involved in cell wall biosynthesis